MAWRALGAPLSPLDAPGAYSRLGRSPRCPDREPDGLLRGTQAAQGRPGRDRLPGGRVGRRAGRVDRAARLRRARLGAARVDPGARARLPAGAGAGLGGRPDAGGPALRARRHRLQAHARLQPALGAAGGRLVRASASRPGATAIWRRGQPAADAAAAAPRRRALDRGAALRQHERRPGQRIFLRRPGRDHARHAGAGARPEGDRAHLLVRVQGQARRRARDRPHARRRAPARGQRAAGRRDRAHHRAADPHQRRRAPVVAALRPQARPTCSRSRTRSPPRW